MERPGNSQVSEKSRRDLFAALGLHRTSRGFMGLVRLLGFTTLTCGCVSGRYREAGSERDITYIEEKGAECGELAHRRNQPVSATRVAHGFDTSDVSRAS
jgi:hypothetical protein